MARLTFIQYIIEQELRDPTADVPDLVSNQVALAGSSKGRSSLVRKKASGIPLTPDEQEVLKAELSDRGSFGLSNVGALQTPSGTFIRTSNTQTTPLPQVATKTLTSAGSQAVQKGLNRSLVSRAFGALPLNIANPSNVVISSR